MRGWLLGLVFAASLLGDESVPEPPPRPMPSPAVGPPCHSVKDCWLDESGRPIQRPKSQRGKALPRGDCGGRINWLRNHLGCSEDHRCVTFFVGDRC